MLKDVITVLEHESRRTSHGLYNAITKSNLSTMHALLQGTAGATYIGPTTERTGMSLKMTVQNQPETFQSLPDKDESFSIRRWVYEKGSSWMFITAQEAMHEVLKPVLSLWINTAIRAVLDLESIRRERLWFCIDKLPILQKLDILKLALANTRKYGLCMVLGVQGFSQLYEIYGHDPARTIISGCQTKLLLHMTDGAAMKLLAELMGQAKVDGKNKTLSYGLSSQHNSVSVMACRQVHDFVPTSEILTLPDMTGYLLIPGDCPIARVEYGYVPIEKQANGFIERDGFAIGFKPTAAAAAPAPALFATEVQQPATPEQSDMLDDDNTDAPVTVGVVHNGNDDVIDKIADEIIKPTEKVSRTKGDADTKSAGQGKKPSPLADVLQKDTE